MSVRSGAGVASRRYLTAPLLSVALVVGLLTACTPDSDDPASSAGASSGAPASDAASAAATEEETSDGRESEGSEDEVAGGGDTAAESSSPQASPSASIDADDLAAVEPMVPTKDQAKAYLADRVPDGVDAESVLQLGTEACDRMHYLEVVSPDVLREALAGDEYPQWPDAVEHLCPDLEQYLS